MSQEKNPKKNEDEETEEIDVVEFSLSLNEINDLIGKLDFLRRTKTKVSFNIDSSNELIIHYFDENSEDDEDEEKSSNKDEDSEEDVNKEFEEFEGDI